MDRGQHGRTVGYHGVIVKKEREKKDSNYHSTDDGKVESDWRWIRYRSSSVFFIFVDHGGLYSLHSSPERRH